MKKYIYTFENWREDKRNEGRKGKPRNEIEWERHGVMMGERKKVREKGMMREGERQKMNNSNIKNKVEDEGSYSNK